MTLAQIADELYGLPLDEFTAARNKHNDPAVKKLPKPSAAAWAINQFVRQSPDKLAQVIALGEQLREAQDDLDAATLRTLGTQRRALISAVAKEIGGPPSIRTDVEQTLQAAMADRWAAVAVSSGRLLRSLTADGLDPADLEGAVAGPSPSAPAKKKPNDLAKKRAQAALDAATRAREAAEQAVADVEQRIDASDDEEQELSRAVDELSAQLAEARARLDAAEAASGRLGRERSTLVKKLEQAEVAEEKAKS